MFLSTVCSFLFEVHYCLSSALIILFLPRLELFERSHSHSVEDSMWRLHSASSLAGCLDCSVALGILTKAVFPFPL